MELDQLRTFLAVLEHGGFSRAAQALHIGQSTVSFHVKALETSVGARLLDRRGGGVRATPAGKVLRRYAQRIVALREEALGRVRAEETGASGRVVIAASTIPAEYLLPQVIARFRGAHDGVEVVVEVSDSRRAAAALLAEECDLAVVGSRVQDRRVECTAFAEDEIVLVGPTHGRWAARGGLDAETLASVPLVTREEGSGTREAVAGLLARRARAGGAPRAAPVIVGSTEAAKRCVLRGLGVTFVSRRAVEDEVAAGTLQVLRYPGTPVTRRFFVAQLRGHTLPAAVRAFREALLGARPRPQRGQAP